MCRKFGICLAGPYSLAKEHAYLLGSGVGQPSRASPCQAAPSPPHLIANRSPKRPRHGTERRRCRRLRFRTTPWSFAAGDPPDEFPFAPLFSSLPTVSRAPERRAAGRPVPQAAMARSFELLCLGPQEKDPFIFSSYSCKIRPRLVKTQG